MPRNLISAADLSKQDILDIFSRADELSKSIKNHKVDTTKQSCLLFFESSTRTRVGFETASWRLGIRPVILQETKANKSMSKAESIRDTIKTLNPYVSFYFIRHPDNNIFEEVVPFTDHPVINCGNGYQEHPTQALIDAYTIWKKFQKLDGLTITIIGQLKYARAVHSLLILLSNFSDISINEVAPDNLRVQDKYEKHFKVSNNGLNAVKNHIWGREQVVYVSGFPPKNPSGTFSEIIRNKYKVTLEIANKLNPESIVINDLPRTDEIDKEVDQLPNAHYFKQNELGSFVRLAIIDRFCL